MLQIYDATKVVTTAGTREALGGTQRALWIIVQAKPGNTDVVYLGGVTIASGRGITVDPGGTKTYPFVSLEERYNLAGIFVDAAVSGEGVDFEYADR